MVDTPDERTSLAAGYDYPALIAAACAALHEIEGKTLEKCLVHVVPPEFNVVFLVFSDSSYAVHGRIGGEILGIARLEEPPTEGGDEVSVTDPFELFEIFLGRRVSQARMIGEAWNGHGFEISFEGLADRTMIIQSIYSAPKPPELHDCLRLGVGHYVLEASAGT